MLLSGGIDSATCLFKLRGEYSTTALTFVYRGMARAEVGAAKKLAARGGAKEHRIVRLPDLREAGDIRGAGFGGRPPTYIPARNGVFYSYAASVAEEIGAGVVVGGHNRDDRRTFPDSRREFFDVLHGALRKGSPALAARGFEILLPLSQMGKSEVVAEAERVGVPLDLTWSCHRSGRVHCGRCPGCRGRVKAFIEARVSDPLAESVRGKLLKA